MSAPPRALAVVTRTLNRPLFLERALASVAAQTRRDFIWVIVNDGGERGPVDAIAAKAAALGLAVETVHHPQSHGMEAASNAGVRSTNSEFIAIHDDDDSWRPDFIAAMLKRIESAGPECVGIACWTMEQRERLSGQSLRSLSARPSPYLPQSVTLAQLALRNQFPPIAFLYRRALFDALGGYDESLPVLGDWDFNLRAAERGEIAVEPTYLARYHVRVGAQGAAANSVVDRLQLHRDTEALIRNRRLRQDMAEGRPGLGVLMATAVMLEHAANAAAERASPWLRLRRWLRGDPRRN